MGKAAAKQGDKITAKCNHMINVETPNGTVTSPSQFDFSGSLKSGLSADVRINSEFAAVGKSLDAEGSGAENDPHHDATKGTPSGSSFVSTPSDAGKVAGGSATVRINGKPAVRHGDSATTCTEPPSPGNGQVEVVDAATADVFFGD